MSLEMIYVLFSGVGLIGVVVICVFGLEVLNIIILFCRKIFEDWVVYLSCLIDRDDNLVFDEVLVFYFKGFWSFMGEDVVEFYIYGGWVVISFVLVKFSIFFKCCMVEWGEFFCCGFENGKFDLIEVEGLVDLIVVDILG